VSLSFFPPPNICPLDLFINGLKIKRMKMKHQKAQDTGLVDITCGGSGVD
jgi:hypothetical protein